MDIRKDILIKYLEMAAVEQLASDYREEGYEVEIERMLGKHRADVVARKEGMTIVFEIKAGEWSKSRRVAVSQLRNYIVHKMGGKFKLVLVKLPETPDIAIDEFEAILTELLPEQFNDEFSRLATHYWIDEITDIYFDVLHIRKDEIEISGVGTVTLGLQYGSDLDYQRDDGVRFTEAYNLSFHLLLSRAIEIKEILGLEIDFLENNTGDV